jgi:hypothetical protein
METRTSVENSDNVFLPGLLEQFHLILARTGDDLAIFGLVDQPSCRLLCFLFRTKFVTLLELLDGALLHVPVGGGVKLSLSLGDLTRLYGLRNCLVSRGLNRVICFVGSIIVGTTLTVRICVDQGFGEIREGEVRLGAGVRHESTLRRERRRSRRSNAL